MLRTVFRFLSKFVFMHRVRDNLITLSQLLVDVPGARVIATTDTAKGLDIHTLGTQGAVNVKIDSLGLLTVVDSPHVQFDSDYQQHIAFQGCNRFQIVGVFEDDSSFGLRMFLVELYSLGACVDEFGSFRVRLHESFKICRYSFASSQSTFDFAIDHLCGELLQSESFKSIFKW